MSTLTTSDLLHRAQPLLTQSALKTCTEQTVNDDVCIGKRSARIRFTRYTEQLGSLCIETAVVGQLLAELDDTAGIVVLLQDTCQRITVAAVVAAADGDHDLTVPIHRAVNTHRGAVHQRAPRHVFLDRHTVALAHIFNRNTIQILHALSLLIRLNIRTAA